MPANAIRDIVQTKDGYLWLGTQMGLLRFDGISFESINLPDQPQFRRGPVTRLACAAKGGLWFGVDGGSFGFYDRAQFYSMERKGWTDPAMGVGGLMEASDGWLWVGTGAGTARCLGGDTNKGTLFPKIVGVSAICEDAQHRIWLGTTDLGLFYWQAGQLKPFPDSTLVNKAIFAVAVDRQGRIWVGTQAGVQCYDANFVRHDLVQTSTDVKDLLVDQHGVVWIGTAGDGLIRYGEGEAQYLKHTDGLANDSVTSLAEDAEGDVWVGTKDGLTQLSDVKLPIYTIADGMMEGSCHDLCAASNGGIWTATTKGLSWFDGKKFTRFAEDIGLTNAYVKRVFEARNGDVYFLNAARTGDREVDILSKGKIVARYPSSGWPIAFAEDAHGVVVAVGGELFRVSRTQFTPYVYRDGKVPLMNWVRNLFGCADGSLLVASVNGIFRIKDGAVEHWSVDEGLSDFDVLWVSADNDGTIWAGLRTGFARIRGKQIRNLNQNDGLADNFIRAIVPDNHGNLWMQSSRGFLWVSRRNVNDFADGKTNRVDCAIYDGLESVKSIETLDAECDGCKTRDGRIWFPTPLGVVMIDPEHMPTDLVPPLVHINQVRVNGTVQTDPNASSARPGRGELVIQYTALSYIAPQKVQFRYQLQGYDPDWIDGGNRRSVFYANLKPKHYTFVVQACNADGVWSKNDDRFEINLPPHYYQTVWFGLVASLVGMAAIFGGYVWRVRWMIQRQRDLQRDNEILESKIRQRTGELAEQRNLLRTLIDHLPDSIFVKDRQSRVLTANVAHAQLLGLRHPDEAVGKTDLDCLPPEQAKKFYAAEQQLLRSGTEYNAEETIVDARTGEIRWLRTTKVPLRDGSGKIIGLAGISRDISERKKWEAESESLHSKLVQASHQAGMAEVATSVLHNVGNVLNSANVSAGLLATRLRKLQISSLAKVVQLLQARAGDLGHFLTADEKGRLLPQYLEKLAAHLGEEQVNLLMEIKALTENMEHIKGIVAAQQTYAKMAGVSEVVRSAELVEQAIRLQLDAYKRHSVRLIREFAEVPPITVDRHKAIQIVVNLLQNAKQACEQNEPDRRQVIVRLSRAGTAGVRLQVADNGIGISPENLTRIFSHGFTTRKDGHGFGLHSGALAAKELGGSMTAFSEGPGKGATFTLELPVELKSVPS